MKSINNRILRERKRERERYREILAQFSSM